MRDTRVTQGRTTRRRRATLRGLRWTPAAEFTSCSRDRKSTRLNSSHANISYAVFCLKKKKKKNTKRNKNSHTKKIRKKYSLQFINNKLQLKIEQYKLVNTVKKTYNIYQIVQCIHITL